VALPADRTDGTEPVDPMEAIEAAEPVDPMEPVELTERIDPVESTDHSDDRRGPTPTAGRPGAVPSVTGAQAAAVTTGWPAGVSTYQSPPALVSAWPVAIPGVRSGGHR